MVLVFCFCMSGAVFSVLAPALPEKKSVKIVQFFPETDVHRLSGLDSAVATFLSSKSVGSDESLRS